MTLTLWSCLLLIGIALVWVVREVRAAARLLRPVRIGVVFSAALVLASSAVVGLSSGVAVGGMLGLPRRYATYQPAPSFDWWALVPAAGLGLLAGAFIGALRTSDGTITPKPAAARTRNRLAAAAGLVLLITGAAGIALHR